MSRIRRIKAAVCERLLDFALKHHPDANGSITAYAEEELSRAGWYDEDAFYGDMVAKAVLRSVRVFSMEGHSGISAGIVSGITKSVCMFRPLTPLTGADDEWNEVGDGVLQNRRMSSVFKDPDGRAYWISGRVFREPSGATYTSRDSRVDIQFPWLPGDPEIVEVPA